MKRAAIAIAIAIASFFIAASALAEGDEKKEPEIKLDTCRTTVPPEDRLKCFDAYGAQEHKKGEDAKAKERTARRADEDKPIHWHIRDSSTISAAGDADIGSKPAQFQLGRSDGADFSTVKLSAIGIFHKINQPGGFFDTWLPFTALSWNRDTSSKTPKDQRQYILGMTGGLYAAPPGATNMVLTGRIGYKDDVRQHTHGEFVNIHADVIVPALVSDPETDSTNALSTVPYFGLLDARNASSPAATADGRYLGRYVGVKFVYQAFAWVPRLSGTASAQWFRDWHAPSAASARRDKYLNLGLNYDLVDPKATRGWVPSITLTREHGADPVTGAGPANKTVLGFGVKFD